MIRLTRGVEGMKATITYEVRTAESEAVGKVAAHGWWLPGNWEYALRDAEGHHDDVLAEARAGVFDLPLEDALKHARELGCREEVGLCRDDCFVARSEQPIEDRRYFEDGESRYYCLRVSEVDADTLVQIRDLFHQRHH